MKKQNIFLHRTVIAVTFLGMSLLVSCKQESPQKRNNPASFTKSKLSKPDMPAATANDHTEAFKRQIAADADGNEKTPIICSGPLINPLSVEACLKLIVVLAFNFI